MKKLSCDVLVIGGGATGTGLARDLAMRGFKTTLVEQRDLTHGTTGRYHGLLHSGGRYVVKDPQAAHECYQENCILRKIMPQCIEDTGGFFVLTPWDDTEYVAKFLAGCQLAGIPVEELSIRQMLREEPSLNPEIKRCFRVPDGAADSFLAAHLNAESARQYGASILTYHQVSNLLREGNHIRGAECYDLINDQQVHISASLVVNAAGAWAGKISATADIPIQMIPGKGTMLAVNHRVVNTVINRCKMPSDGDILVPAHTVAVIGTTDIKVNDPDIFGIEPWELQLLLNEGARLIPDFQKLRILRAWAGVRPLFQETASSSQNRDVTRAFVLLDHADRDGIEGMLTITSGKWTTYRKMAEVTADKVCEKLRVTAECRTHLEELPLLPAHKSSNRSIPSDPSHQLGARLSKVEDELSYGNLICECELVTLIDLQEAIANNPIHTIDDLRRDLRIGMGPCQGGFCTLRTAGTLHALGQIPLGDINAAIRDFLDERWKGQKPVQWGQQLRQNRLNQLIYQDVLNIEGLPGADNTPLAAEKYSSHNQETTPEAPRTNSRKITVQISNNSSIDHTDVLVIGAGLSGLVAGWRASRQGKKVQVITKGWGANYWGSGCIDIQENLPPSKDEPLSPTHPYYRVGSDVMQEAILSFQDLCRSHSYPMNGTFESNWQLPTALGSFRSTCLAPETMIAGAFEQRSPLLILGFAQYVDFFPELIADNLNTQSVLARSKVLDLPSLQTRRFVTSIVLARLFDTPKFRNEVVEAIQPFLGSDARLGFPAVLGLKQPLVAKHDLEEQLGLPVFEIPGLPPSIPGMRLHNILCNEITRLGGKIMNGMQVIGCETDGKSILHVISEAAARVFRHSAENYILATGGILGGGITVDSSGLAQDSALGIPIQTPPDLSIWHNDSFISSTPHPLNCIGFSTDLNFQPCDTEGKPLYTNLYAVGGALGGFDPLHERSLEGVSLVTGYVVGEQLS